MEVTVGSVITVVSLVIAYAVGYGILNQKVNDLRDHRKLCEKRFDNIESEHASSNKQLTDIVHNIEATLNQLVGRIDMFFSTTSIHLTKKD